MKNDFGKQAVPAAKKYELIPSDKAGLFRVRALRDFGDVKAGEIGGYVESEHNLSHLGEAWVCDRALVCDDASVRGNARVNGNAKVYGKARASDDARIGGSAEIFDDACVRGNSTVSGNARVGGRARLDEDADVRGSAWITDDVQVAGTSMLERGLHCSPVPAQPFGPQSPDAPELRP
jgi:UDP-3-O-[3-hydroxymyristoyl] glucosamine N-acyltransferase